MTLNANATQPSSRLEDFKVRLCQPLWHLGAFWCCGCRPACSRPGFKVCLVIFTAIRIPRMICWTLVDTPTFRLVHCQAPWNDWLLWWQSNACGYQALPIRLLHAFKRHTHARQCNRYNGCSLQASFLSTNQSGWTGEFHPAFSFRCDGGFKDLCALLCLRLCPTDYSCPIVTTQCRRSH